VGGTVYQCIRINDVNRKRFEYYLKARFGHISVLSLQAILSPPIVHSPSVHLLTFLFGKHLFLYIYRGSPWLNRWYSWWQPQTLLSPQPLQIKSKQIIRSFQTFYFRESLVSDIPAGDGKTANIFLQCMRKAIYKYEFWFWYRYPRPPPPPLQAHMAIESVYPRCTHYPPHSVSFSFLYRSLSSK
jgi:hypothetical protein